MSSMNYNNLKYNYVVFFAHCDYHKAIFGVNNDCVHFYDYTFGENKFIKLINKFHWSYSINKRFNLPLKSLWFRKMYNQKFINKDKPLCFVYIGGNSIKYDSGWCDYVRKRNSKNKQVIVHEDLISKKIDYDYNLLRKKVDLCTTYDRRESIKYGISYVEELFYQKLKTSDTKQLLYDVYFLGAIKDRYSKIMDVYNYLHSNELKCKFILVGVPIDKQIELDGVEYSNGISYMDNLDNIIKSKCILEIVQKNSYDITMRALEAISYKKLLITDCKGCNIDYFNDNQVQIFDKPEDIDTEIIKKKTDLESLSQIIDLNVNNRFYIIDELLGG